MVRLMLVLYIEIVFGLLNLFLFLLLLVLFGDKWIW